MSDFIIDAYRFAPLDYDALVVAHGATGFWPMQGASTAADEDAIGTNDLTWTGSPTFQVAGPSGWEAVRFNGTTQYGRTVGATGLPDGNIACSFECWFKSDSASTLRTIAMFRQVTVGEELLGMLHNTPANGNTRGYRNGGFATTGAGALNDSGWHHRVDVVDGANYKVYIDGALLQTGAYAGVATGAVEWTVVVAANYTTIGGPIQFFAGDITKVAVYPVALTLPQVASHYAAVGT